MDSNVLNSVIVTAADGTNRQTMATGAGTTRELDILARVDGNAVILVLNDCSGDIDTVGSANIKPVGVMPAVMVTVRVVDGDILEMQVIRLHADRLHRGILDAQPGECRTVKLMRVHELGFCLASIRALAVPPARPLSIDNGVISSGHGDFRSAKINQRAVPFLVAEGGGAFKGDLGPVFGIGEVECLACGDLDAAEDNAGAGRGALEDLRGVREGTAVPLCIVRGTRRLRGSGDDGA